MLYGNMFLFVVLASSTNVVARELSTHQDPLWIAFWRVLIAAPALALVLTLTKRKILLHPVDRWRFFVLAVLGVLGNQLLYILGIEHSTATRAALLYGTTPAWVLIMAVWLGMEKFRVWKVGGIALSILGVIIVLAGSGLSFEGGALRGDILLIMAVLSFSAYTALGKPLVERYGALESTFLVMAFGAILYFPIGLPAALTADYSSVTLGDVGLLLYLGLVTSGVVYVLWYWLVGYLRPTQVAVIMCAQPPTTFFIASLFQGEQFTLALLIGSMVTLTGIALTVIGGGEKRNIDFKPARPPERAAEPQ